MLFSAPCLCTKTALPQRDIIPRWQGERGADVGLFVAARVRWGGWVVCRAKKKKNREFILILAKEGQPGAGIRGETCLSVGMGHGWVSQEPWLKWPLSQELDGQLISSGPEGELGLWQGHFILHRTHTLTCWQDHPLLLTSFLFSSVLVAYLTSPSLFSFRFSSFLFLRPVAPLPLVLLSCCALHSSNHLSSSSRLFSSPLLILSPQTCVYIHTPLD